MLIKTEAEFTSDNPTLGEGLYGFESDTGHYKLGDGVTAWNDLSYYHIVNDFERSLIVEQNALSEIVGTKITTTEADYSMQITDGNLFVTCTSANIEITLPHPNLITYSFNDNTYSRILQVTKVDSTAYTVTLVPTSGTIMGETSQVLTSQYDNFTFISDGTDIFER